MTGQVSQAPEVCDAFTGGLINYGQALSLTQPSLLILCYAHLLTKRVSLDLQGQISSGQSA